MMVVRTSLNFNFPPTNKPIPSEEEKNEIREREGVSRSCKIPVQPLCRVDRDRGLLHLLHVLRCNPIIRDSHPVFVLVDAMLEKQC